MPHRRTERQRPRPNQRRKAPLRGRPLRVENLEARRLLAISAYCNVPLGDEPAVESRLDDTTSASDHEHDQSVNNDGQGNLVAEGEFDRAPPPRLPLGSGHSPSGGKGPGRGHGDDDGKIEGGKGPDRNHRPDRDQIGLRPEGEPNFDLPVAPAPPLGNGAVPVFPPTNGSANSAGGSVTLPTDSAATNPSGGTIGVRPISGPALGPALDSNLNRTSDALGSTLTSRLTAPDARQPQADRQNPLSASDGVRQPVDMDSIYFELTANNDLKDVGYLDSGQQFFSRNAPELAAGLTDVSLDSRATNKQDLQSAILDRQEVANLNSIIEVMANRPLEGPAGDGHEWRNHQRAAFIDAAPASELVLPAAGGMIALAIPEDILPGLATIVEWADAQTADARCADAFNAPIGMRTELSLEAQQAPESSQTIEIAEERSWLKRLRPLLVATAAAIGAMGIGIQRQRQRDEQVRRSFESLS